MILPSKHIREAQALIGVGAVLLKALDSPKTVTSLWESVRDSKVIGNFERYVLGLDMLFIIGRINLDLGLISRTMP